MARRKNMMTGFGIGAGLLGLAGAGAGLALAYKKAKDNDKTLRDLIKRKHAKTCCDCDCDCTDSNCKCGCHTDKNNDEILDDAVVLEDDIVSEEDNDTFDLKNNDEMTAEDIIDLETAAIIEGLESERDFYKREYERLYSVVRDLTSTGNETDEVEE